MRYPEDVRPLITAARKNGFTVVPDGRSKHAKVVYGKTFGAKSGQRVMADDGKPLIISTTPSEARNRDLMANRMLKAGVIKREQVPWWNEKPKDDKSGGKRRTAFNDPTRREEIEAAKLAGIREKSQRLNEQTAKLRSRLEPMIVKMGGWKERGGKGSGVAATELAGVAAHFARSRGRMELPKDVSENALKASAQTLKTPGGTLGDRWLPFWTLFVDELERTGDPLGRWLELYREWKGIPERKEVETPAPLPPPGNGRAVVRWHEDDRPQPVVGPVTQPQWSIKAAVMMARSPENSEEAILEVFEKLWQMESER